jgi:hypothetical protein
MTYIRLRYLPRILPFAVYPATVVFNNRPAAGKGPPAHLTGEWIEFIRALNPGEKAFHHHREGGGWVST